MDFGGFATAEVPQNDAEAGTVSGGINTMETGPALPEVIGCIPALLSDSLRESSPHGVDSSLTSGIAFPS